MKTCSRCQCKKELEKFGVKTCAKDGRSPWCKDCHNEWQREYIKRPEVKERRDKSRKKYKDREAVYNRRSKLRKKYGISLEEYDQLYAKQQGVCKICKEPPSDPRGYRLHVDHSHLTGTIRGLLCSNCNAGIGRFKDSIERLEAAIEYLGGN